MIKFNHEEQAIFKAIGFESDREVRATALSAFLAIEAGKELSDKEELVLIYFIVVMRAKEERECPLFDTISQEIEAVWLIKPKIIYEYISKFYSIDTIKKLTPSIQEMLASMD